jgi:hypothetical protein
MTSAVDPVVPWSIANKYRFMSPSYTTRMARACRRVPRTVA